MIHKKNLRVNKHGILDIKYRSRLASNEPFVLAYQAHQVYYASYPSRIRELNDWWAILNIKARSTFNIAETEDQDDNGDVVADDFFQKVDMGLPVVLECEAETSVFSLHGAGEVVVEQHEEEEEEEKEEEEEDEEMEEEDKEDEEEEEEEEKENEDDEDES